ncbi:hypothetical protein PMAYCL1PPCAC_32866, partial [Pristionchus mayeri]
GSCRPLPKKDALRASNWRQPRSRTWPSTRISQCARVGLVIATGRYPESAKELRSVKNPKLHVVACDVADEQSVASAVGKVTKILDGKGLDILVNNAGIFLSRTLEDNVSKAAVMEQFEVNA